MRITDIIRGVLDLVDRSEQPEQAEPAVAGIEIAVAEPEMAGPGPEEQLAIMQHLAGIVVPEEECKQYDNSPAEVISPMSAAFPNGDDMHHSKNPADIKSNSISMYPNYQAK